jgi:hypothetical protein
MSTSAGAGGAFGILLSAVPEVADLYAELKFHVNDSLDANYAANADEVSGLGDFKTRFITAFKNLGITVPDGAQLLETGKEDERPGECSTAGDEFVLGFGLFTNPWDYPVMDQSFKDAADWHTWAWAG